MNTKGSMFTSGVATGDNTNFGVHEWNKIRSYTEKNQIFCFFYAFIYNNYAFTYSSTLTPEN